MHFKIPKGNQRWGRIQDLWLTGKVEVASVPPGTNSNPHFFKKNNNNHVLHSYSRMCLLEEEHTGTKHSLQTSTISLPFMSEIVKSSEKRNQSIRLAVQHCIYTVKQ